MCRHRFGVLNDLHSELLSEGITDIHFMGMNGFQYINDANACMMCSDPELCSNCEDTHHLPWTQDYDDGINCLIILDFVNLMILWVMYGICGI